MQSAGWYYRAALILTRLAIAVVNSVNCIAQPALNFSERASSLWCNLFCISAGLCPEVVRGSRVRGQNQIAQFWHDAVSYCTGTQRCSCSHSCAVGALFIARVSVDNLTGRGTRSLLPTLSELPRPRVPRRISRYALRLEECTLHLGCASSETGWLVSHENCIVPSDAYVIAQIRSASYVIRVSW